jgi:hypothetical protein
MNYLEKNMKYYESLVNDLLEKKQQAEDGLRAKLNPKQPSNISDFQQQCQKLSTDRDSIKNFPRKLRSVFATSGIWIDPNHENTVDWALVNVDAQRFNQIPVNLVSFNEQISI